MFISPEAKIWAWRLYLPAFAVLPAYFGWFDANRLECNFCFKDVFLYSLAVFGYAVLVGMVYTLRFPRETRSDAQFTAMLLCLFFGGMAFFLAYKPL